jgi:predicted amidohydrolase
VLVAACQIPASVDAPDPAILAAAVREAAGRGARLVVLPELAACGYVFRDAAEARAAAEPTTGPTVTLLRELSAELGCVLVAGFAELGDDGQVHNSVALTDGGGLVAVYRKVHLWGSEPDLFRAGDARPAVVDTSAGRIGLLICYDLEFPEWARLAAEAGAEILAVPVNWPLLPRPAGVPALETVKAQAAAGTYRVHVVVADRCGSERGVDWVGGSLVCGADGYLLAGPATAPGSVAGPAVLVADLDPVAARDKAVGPRNHAVHDRRPELY